MNDNTPSFFSLGGWPHSLSLPGNPPHEAPSDPFQPAYLEPADPLMSHMAAGAAAAAAAPAPSAATLAAAALAGLRGGAAGYDDYDDMPEPSGGVSYQHHTEVSCGPELTGAELTGAPHREAADTGTAPGGNQLPYT
jgi:hypothetical protein